MAIDERKRTTERERDEREAAGREDRVCIGKGGESEIEDGRNFFSARISETLTWLRRGRGCFVAIRFVLGRDGKRRRGGGGGLALISQRRRSEFST